MKSKSCELAQSSKDNVKGSKTWEFVELYKSAADTKFGEICKSSDHIDKENSFGGKQDVSKRRKGNNKNISIEIPKEADNRTLDVSIDKTLIKLNSLSNATTTILTVKSIMKNSSNSSDEVQDSTSPDTSKRKKRNKSVSFMLDDAEEIAVKKTKSNESITGTKHKSKLDNVKKVDNLRRKKARKSKTKNNSGVSNISYMDVDNTTSSGTIDKEKPNNESTETMESSISDSQNTNNKDKRKKFKKLKRMKGTVLTEYEGTNNEEQIIENREKRTKKKKRLKQLNDTTNKKMETEGEPKTKTRKKEIKPDVITENLENLSIGENTHTLTHLLDEMTVADESKKKKKPKRKKGNVQTSTSSSGTIDLENIEGGKEKFKWKKRKWNKDKKGESNDSLLTRCVLVQNLPLTIMCNYKGLLAEHFEKCGLIQRIGIAEVYPTEESKPIFMTTIYFYSEEAATMALQEDNTLFQGNHIHVKRPLPTTETTLVVRCYADLTEQLLSSIFTSAGKIRKIRHLLKGRKSIATAFIEFDGPEAVERAIRIAEDIKIGGKKIHASKFELRKPKKKCDQQSRDHFESENEGDSENSND